MLARSRSSTTSSLSRSSAWSRLARRSILRARSRSPSARAAALRPLTCTSGSVCVNVDGLSAWLRVCLCFSGRVELVAESAGGNGASRGGRVEKRWVAYERNEDLVAGRAGAGESVRQRLHDGTRGSD